MKQHYWISFFSSLLLFIGSATAQLTSLVEKNEKAVFVIEAYNEFGVCTASGTGFFIDNSGVGLTALHVLAGAKFAYAKNYEGDIYRIEKISSVCEDCDMVKFQVVTNGKLLPYITTISTLPAKGTDLFIIGNPEGYKNSVTTGILSGTKMEKGNKIIQTTAPISSGSSGSPLMNMKGQAIGVISYSHAEGQNLNFAYSIACLDSMKPSVQHQLISPYEENIFFINSICSGEKNLTLHSIELSDIATVVNYSYSNASIAFGEGAFIYSVIGDSSQSMYIKDRLTDKKYYATKSTLGVSVCEPTTMKFGETVYFKMFFPPIGNINMIDIAEDMKGGDWSFNNLIIPMDPFIAYYKLEDFFYSSFQAILSDMNDGYMTAAYKSIKECYSDDENSERLNLLGAIVAYALEKNEESTEFLKKAIELRPNHSQYYADLYTIHMEMNLPTQALAYINSAIQCNDEYIEYSLMRAEANYLLENWTDAIKDFQLYINSGRTPSADMYLKMGISKNNVNDSSACDDFKKAKDLAESDREWEKFNKEYRKYCK